MRNKRLAQRQKELGLEIVENNNRNFIETMRGAARMLARKKEIISNDDLRDWTAMAGDWILKSVENEDYPCKTDIFEKTYGKAEIRPPPIRANYNW